MQEEEKKLKGTLLSRSDVCSFLGVGRDYIYKLEKDPAFPKPIKVGRIRRWYESEIQTFLENSRKMED